MKKNGFTLIELLAVILILGIIALIAIPTVTSIIEDAKKQSYTRSAEGLLSSIENKISIELLKGNSSYKAYNFDDNKLLNGELDINGTMPKKGQVRVNGDGEILMAIVYDNYCLTKKFDNSEILITKLNDSKCSLPGTKNELKNYAYWSNEISAHTYDKVDYMSDQYVNKIISINYLYSNYIPNNIIDNIVWDLSQAQDNSIKGYLLANGQNYDLYIISENTISYDTSGNFIIYKFLPNLTNINFYNFDTSNATHFSRMFKEYMGTSLDLTGFDTSNASSMYEMFSSARNLENVNISSFDTSNVSDISYLFYCCVKLEKIDMSSFNTSKVTTMRRMFNSCIKLSELDLSSFDTSNATNMTEMFKATSLLTKIYISNKWDISNADTTSMCTNSGSYIDENTCNLVLK